MTRVEISLTFSLRNTCDIPSRSNSKRNKQYRLTVNWHASIYLLPYAAPIRSSVCQRTEFPKRTMISGRRIFFSVSLALLSLRKNGGLLVVSRTYRKGYYFYSPQSFTVIKSKMAAITIQTWTRFRLPKIRLRCRLIPMLLRNML